jgi:hypothetical protein
MPYEKNGRKLVPAESGIRIETVTTAGLTAISIPVKL